VENLENHLKVAGAAVRISWVEDSDAIRQKDAVEIVCPFQELKLWHTSHADRDSL
jgi:hypothetical protein